MHETQIRGTIPASGCRRRLASGSGTNESGAQSGLPPFTALRRRLSTGGGFSTRELYSDGEEKLFNAMRPILLNGINEVATRSDLLDRTMALTLPTIKNSRRKTEAELSRAFQHARPRILGGLLDAVSTALRRVDDVQLDTMPRMADFAVWVVAAEPSLDCASGAFLRAYAANRETLNESAIESCMIAEPLMKFLNGREQWEGTASELLQNLGAQAGERTTKQREWPKKPHVLSGHLRRIAPNLRQMDINIEFYRETNAARRRRISIRTSPQPSVQSVQSVQYSTDDGPGASIERPGASTVSPKNNGENAFVDASDAVSPACSGDVACPVKHKKPDCTSTAWWEHCFGGRYCRDCWPPTDDSMVVRSA